MTLSPEVLGLLSQALGVRGPGRPVPDLTELRLPEPRLPEAARDQLVAALGAEHMRDDPQARALHTRGKSLSDLLRLRAGEADDAPDLVLLPGSHEEVLAVLAICSEQRVAVVPFGGGTSVVGGLEPSGERFAGVVAVDVRRLDRLVEVDDESRIATLEPGLRSPQAEALLSEHGFTIGHFPQSFEYATIGGAAAARASGQASAGYGRFDERVVRLRLATPSGTLELGRAPKSAAGPDLRQLILGSEGAFGVITSLAVEVSPAPAQRVYEGWRFGSFAEGTLAIKQLVQDGPVPTVLRLSDEAETALNLARPTEIGAPGSGGCLAIVGYEGSEADVEARRAGATAVLRDCGAEPEAGAGEGWERERYKGPYLRDALLDAGALAETLETATWWSGLPRLYEAVGTALRQSLTEQGSPPVVLCHLSHMYRSGASLYYTVGAAQLDDPVGQWRAAEAAACDAILEAGGTITHHHGIGSDHRDWYPREVGELGVQVLRAVKGALDPAGIMNPGVLVP
jgi:alkyldihydroxyacetonephosphate synthase